jgi:hypothetical protein
MPVVVVQQLEEVAVARTVVAAVRSVESVQPLERH